MGIEHLHDMFHPDSVAVIGASDRTQSIGSAIMRNLIEGDFAGRLFPVNPNHKKIWKIKAHRSVEDIDHPVDLAIIATPIPSVARILKECIKKEVKGAVILSAGGKETGDRGRQIERAILNDVKGSKLRIIGPNCLGIMCSQSNLNASFARHKPLPGNMAFISQSGAICTAILDLSIKEKIGFSHFISVGSMLDINFGDLVDYLGNDPRVKSIVMYVESLTRFRHFMSAARAVSRMKPIVVLKAGRTDSGALAAASHTGALAGEDAVYDAALKRAGILRVKTFEELFDCAELLAKQPFVKGPNLAIITNAGGPGVMATDALSDFHFNPVTPEPDTLKELHHALPVFWSRGNPIDILGDATPERYRAAVEVCLKAPEFHGLLIIFAPQAVSHPTDVATALVDLLKGHRKPVVTTWLGGAHVEEGREIFNRAGIPTFDTPERAVRAFMDMHHYSRRIEMLQEIPPKIIGDMHFDKDSAAAIIHDGLKTASMTLRETEAKQLLHAYGIPVINTQTASSPDEAVEKANQIGFPVVLKVDSRDVPHKSDNRGVWLDLKSDAEVIHAYGGMMHAMACLLPEARIEGVTIQPMIRDAHYELILGTKTDRDFGPVIMFGTGGTMTEIHQDRVIALPPLNRLLAGRMMEETRIYMALKGFRGRPAADLVQLENILIRLSQLVIDFPEITELDINPLTVSGDKIWAVDARVFLKHWDKKPFEHLVISPYPNQYESRREIKDGPELAIRPIKPEDASLLDDLFQALTPRSIYFRFFRPIKRMDHGMLVRFTQIDYDREIAMVAIMHEDNKERMLGVARIIRETKTNSAEFSVVVEDAWHGRGIGAHLLDRCLVIAEEKGIQNVWGLVLPENRQMIALGQKLGMKLSQVPRSNEYELTMTFPRHGTAGGSTPAEDPVAARGGDASRLSGDTKGESYHEKENITGS